MKEEALVNDFLIEGLKRPKYSGPVSQEIEDLLVGPSVFNQENFDNPKLHYLFKKIIEYERTYLSVRNHLYQKYQSQIPEGFDHQWIDENAKKLGLPSNVFTPSDEVELAKILIKEPQDYFVEFKYHLPSHNFIFFLRLGHIMVLWDKTYDGPTEQSKRTSWEKWCQDADHLDPNIRKRAILTLGLEQPARISEMLQNYEFLLSSPSEQKRFVEFFKGPDFKKEFEKIRFSRGFVFKLSSNPEKDGEENIAEIVKEAKMYRIIEKINEEKEPEYGPDFISIPKLYFDYESQDLAFFCLEEVCDSSLSFKLKS